MMLSNALMSVEYLDQKDTLQHLEASDLNELVDAVLLLHQEKADATKICCKSESGECICHLMPFDPNTLVVDLTTGSVLSTVNRHRLRIKGDKLVI